MMRRYLICDLDGTISNPDHRLPWARRAYAAESAEARRDAWHEFHRRAVDDVPYYGERELLNAWEQFGNHILYLSGRYDCYMDETRHWLYTWGFPLRAATVLLRPEHDTQSSPDYKTRRLRHFIDGNKDVMISMALDDDDRVVARWRALGIACLQPRPTVIRP